MNPILKELQEKFGEWLEMAGDNSSALTIDLLCQLVNKERNNNEYYKKLLKLRERGHVCTCPTK